MENQTPTSNPRVRVLIVDDIAQVRSDLRLLLELSGWLEVAGEAAGGLEAVELAETLRPDVVLMDLEMPEMDGFAATRCIKARKLAKRVVILSVHTTQAEAQFARLCGADAFVPKGAPYQILIQAIMAAGSPC